MPKNDKKKLTASISTVAICMGASMPANAGDIDLRSLKIKNVNKVSYDEFKKSLRGNGKNDGSGTWADQIHDGTWADQIHDGTWADQVHDGTWADQIHDGTWADQIHGDDGPKFLNDEDIAKQVNFPKPKK